jgi:peptidase M50-like protein
MGEERALRVARAPTANLLWPVLAILTSGVILPLVCAEIYTRMWPEARLRGFSIFGLTLAMVLGITYGVLLVHELGHVVGCRLVGFRVVELAVAPVAVRFDGRAMRMRLVSTVLRGWVRSDPVRPEALRWRDCVMAMCGPGANLVVAVTLALVAVMDASLHHHRTLFDGVIGLNGVLNALAGLMALTPHRMWAGGWRSDGMWVWLWLRHPERAAAALARGTLSIAAEAGIRPRDWDARWLSLAAGSRDRKPDGDLLGGNLLAYAWALDRGDLERAASHLKLAFSRRRLGGRRMRQAIAIEMAYFTARHGADPAAAERLLDAEVRKPFDGLMRDATRARAAAALAAGRTREALDLCERVLPDLPPDGNGLTMLDREQLEAVRDEALSAMRTIAGGDSRA